MIIVTQLVKFECVSPPKFMLKLITLCSCIKQKDFLERHLTSGGDGLVELQLLFPLCIIM